MLLRRMVIRCSLVLTFRILAGEFHIFRAYLVISSVLIETDGL